MKDTGLLQPYVEAGSEVAFQELVKRHLDFVYTTACRQLSDPNLAEDVTQTIFCLLARQASNLTEYKTLLGWI